jgi:GNAT superfamily N-acetyltransferase
MNIREFTLSDQAGINKLQDEFMAEFFPGLANDPGQFEWNADIYDIDECYLKNGGKAWVVDIDDFVAGFGGFRLVSPEIAEIKRVRIDSRHRGKGIGKSIIRQIENYCKAAGIQKLLVDTDDRFEAAISMYTGMGYSIYLRESYKKDGTTFTDNFYEKILGN